MKESKMDTEYIFADAKWTGTPGGSVVKRYQRDGVKYVDVVFKRTPDKIYTYYA